MFCLPAPPTHMLVKVLEADLARVSANLSHLYLHVPNV